MTGPLDHETVEALLKKHRALAARDQKRVDELEARNADTLQEICTSLTVPASAFGMSYARGYWGEKASIFGIPIDAGVGLLLHGIAACFGVSVSKGAQRVGKFFHDVANGALASWTAALGAEFGAKKRLEKPVPSPTPQPNVGAVGLAQETPKSAPRPMTLEDLTAIAAGAMSRTPPAQRAPTHAESPAQPVPMTPQSSMPQPSPINTQPTPNGRSATAPASPSTPQKSYRFTQRESLDNEAGLSAIMRRMGPAPDPDARSPA